MGLLTSFFHFLGNCWTLHPRKVSSTFGQDKVSGSLWTYAGSVPLSTQVYNLKTLPSPSLSPFCVSIFSHPPPHHLPSCCHICCLLFILWVIAACLMDCSLFPRNKIDLESTQALFLLVAEKSMSCMSSSMGELYSHYSDPDGFLYITYASQEVFGAPQPAERPPCWSLVHSLNRTELRQIGTNQAGMVSGGFFFLAHTSYLIWTHKQHLCMTWDCTWICLSFFKADCSPGYLPDRMSSGDG